ncbi:ATP-binding protein [bacterium]|nr:ATP-binding protein [bacterium]
MNADERTVDLLKEIAEKYSLDKLAKVLDDKNTLLFKTDIFICLRDIVKAAENGENVLADLKEAKNIYKSPIFAVNPRKGEFLIKSAPDFSKAVSGMGKYSFCFKLSPYHIINTFLAVIEAQITNIDLDALYSKAEKHINDSIDYSLKNNPNWNKDTLTVKNPKLVMPVGAAGCGKSTFYRELSNVVNFSCDNMRYLLFKNFGPCFSSWESGLAWWVVNRATDTYLSMGYNVFYNGVNTDLEYRSPITMENPDPLFAGMPYEVKLVYFEPPAKLSKDELAQLKSINLWAQKIEELDMASLSPNVRSIMELIKSNYMRTLARTKDISEGKAEQNTFDILYAVPAAIVKLFVEQSFDVPQGENVVLVPRLEIPDDAERAAFYRKYAETVIQ